MTTNQLLMTVSVAGLLDDREAAVTEHPVAGLLVGSGHPRKLSLAEHAIIMTT